MSTARERLDAWAAQSAGPLYPRTYTEITNGDQVHAQARAYGRKWEEVHGVMVHVTDSVAAAKEQAAADLEAKLREKGLVP